MKTLFMHEYMFHPIIRNDETKIKSLTLTIVTDSEESNLIEALVEAKNFFENIDSTSTHRIILKGFKQND